MRNYGGPGANHIAGNCALKQGGADRTTFLAKDKREFVLFL